MPDKTPPAPTPAPPPAAPAPPKGDSDVLAVVRGLQEDMTKMRSDHQEALGTLTTERDGLKAKDDARNEADQKAADDLYKTLSDKSKALFDEIKTKLTPNAQVDFMAKLEPSTPSDKTPPPGAPRGEDAPMVDPDADAVVPPGYQPQHAGIVKQKADMVLDHIKGAVRSDLPGVKIFSIPLTLFRKMTVSEYGNDGTGKPSKMR